MSEAAAPETVAPSVPETSTVQVDAEGVPIVEGKSAEEVKAGLKEAVKRSEWRVNGRVLTSSPVLLLRLQPPCRPILLHPHTVQP